MSILSRDIITRELVVPTVISLLLTMLLIVPVTLIGAYHYSSYLTDRDQQVYSDELDSGLNNLKTGIELNLMNQESMDALLRSGDPQTVIDLHFEEFSQVISRSTPGIVGIIVVNDTGTLFAYPEEIRTNSKDWFSIDSDIPGIAEGVEEMMTHRGGKLMGPFDLWDDNIYMVAGEPVLLEGSLWGIQAIIFNLTLLLERAGLSDNDLPIHVQFIDQDGETFFGEDRGGKGDPIERKFILRDLEWKVVATPKNDRTNETSTSLLLFISGEVMISVLVVIVVFLTIRNQIRMSRMVRVRTEELERRSAVLADEVEKRKVSQEELAEANRNFVASLKEVNTLLKLARLHLEGHEGLDEVFGRAVKIIEYNLLDREKQCIMISFDRKVYTVNCSKTDRMLYRSPISVRGVEGGSITLRGRLSAFSGSNEDLSRREKRIIDSIASQLGSIAERWVTQQEEMEARTQAQFYLDLMSHDINNLHQGILINLEMLKMGILSEEKRESSLLVSTDLTRRSIKLVSNVKLLSYLKGLKEPLEPIELNEVVVESIKEVRSSFAGRTVDISMDMPGDQMFILADRLVSEVLINILNNGVKVQPGDTAKMKVEVEPHREKVRVSISDHGPGIRDFDKASLFGRHTGIKREKLMSGIGLSLVKVLMDRYRGRVWIEDRVRGRSEMGARFILEFNGAGNGKTQKVQ
ncbi:MAG: hypothetical protein JXA22_05565 [Candidatus Thermoplasmatota archaeon]|nr:hypothetical protein [Candidatus Thermoplasmatota archaeon]